MEKFTPEQREIMRQRAEADAVLRKDGAEAIGDDRIDLTLDQVKEAKVEMLLDITGRKIESINPNFVITENRPFLADEIIKEVSKVEGIDDEYLSMGSVVRDSVGNIIIAEVKLRENIAYDRFTSSVVYVFEIKGVDTKLEEDIEVSTITRVLTKADYDEEDIRLAVDLEYAETEEEKLVVLEGKDQNAMEGESVGILEFDGKNWKGV
jgi:hypothetical protein